MRGLNQGLGPVSKILLAHIIINYFDTATLFVVWNDYAQKVVREYAGSVPRFVI